MNNKIKIGLVISINKNKTIVIKVERNILNKKYKKIIRKTKHYLVHDELNFCQLGDLILIKQVSPISKLKNWSFYKKLNKI